MSLIADGLLLVAAFSAALYCRILAVRLRRLGNTDKGLGGAISALTIQVEEMKSVLSQVADTADKRAREVQHLTGQADQAARRLELLLATLHQEQDAAEATPAPVHNARFQGEKPQQSTGHHEERQVSRLLIRQRRSAKPDPVG